LTGPFRNAVRVGLDCSRGMERTVQVLAAHCVLKQSRHRGQPKHHAHTCPLNRQGTAAAHSHACFSKGCYSTASCTPLQHLWGSKAHTDTHTYKHTKHTHIHSHSCACAHTYKHKHARKFTQARTHTYTCARTNTQTPARAQVHTHKHTGTHARTHTHLHAYIHKHAYVARVMGFAKFLALLTTLSHLPIDAYLLH
jgi:hypothetical protein